MFKRKRRLKILMSLTTLVFVSITFGGAFVHAVSPDTDPYTDDGRLSLIRCIKKGNLDFGVFWDSVIYNDNLQEGVVEPWVDILYRNQCHANDVIALVRQQDNVRKAVRDAFLTCNTEELPRLKKTFHELTAEIYYVRHSVDGGLALSLPFDLLTTRQFTESVIKDRGAIYNEMYNRYVSADFLSEVELNDLFLELEIKYADRINPEGGPGAYVFCDRSSWQEVAEKWQEFQTHFMEDFGGLKSAKETLEARANEISEDLDNLKITDLVKGDMTFAAYMKSFVQVNINNMEAKEGFEETSAKFLENLPNFTAPSQKDLLGALSSADQVHNVAKLKTEMAANFYVLYKNASDETIATFLDELKGLIDTIDASFPLTTQIKGCADTMNARQCPGT